MCCYWKTVNFIITGLTLFNNGKHHTTLILFLFYTFELYLFYNLLFLSETALIHTAGIPRSLRGKGGALELNTDSFDHRSEIYSRELAFAFKQPKRLVNVK